MTKKYSITISDYSKKGHGLARLKRQSNQAPVKVEVTSAVVGDQLLVTLGKKRKGMIQAEVQNLLSPSKDRISPRCVHASTCGGCSWQQLSYSAQLNQKTAYVSTLFSAYPDATFYPIIPCDDPFHHRNKMEFSFSQNKKGERFLGLIMTRSRGKVINLDECHLTNSWFITLLQAAKTWWEASKLTAFQPNTGEGTLRTLTLREGKNTGCKMAVLTVSGSHDTFIKKAHLNAFKDALQSALPNENLSIFLRIHHAEKGRPTTFYEMHLHGPTTLHETLTIDQRTFDFHISPSAFFQPNTRQAEKLFSRALALASPTPSMRVYDLYAGSGALGMIFAPHVKKVVGIELCAYSVCDGQTNLEINGIPNMNLMQGDVGQVLSDFQLPADLAIIDPPRSGLDPKALEHLQRLNPQKILYISCNPTTQAANIKSLSSYRLMAIQPVDQFPHTPHIENICLLEKKDPNPV